jgi:CubicO group peptidase (beta-lactamase class C family)
MLTIDGHCDPRFTAVREQFFANIFECGPGRRTFGHPGRGGSIGFADPDARVGFGYVTNQYVTGTAKHPDRRVLHLVDAVYAALR